MDLQNILSCLGGTNKKMALNDVHCMVVETHDGGHLVAFPAVYL